MTLEQFVDIRSHSNPSRFGYQHFENGDIVVWPVAGDLFAVGDLVINKFGQENYQLSYFFSENTIEKEQKNPLPQLVSGYNACIRKRGINCFKNANYGYKSSIQIAPVFINGWAVVHAGSANKCGIISKSGFTILDCKYTAEQIANLLNLSKATAAAVSESGKIYSGAPENIANIDDEAFKDWRFREAVRIIVGEGMKEVLSEAKTMFEYDDAKERVEAVQQLFNMKYTSGGKIYAKDYVKRKAELELEIRLLEQSYLDFCKQSLHAGQTGNKTILREDINRQIEPLPGLVHPRNYVPYKPEIKTKSDAAIAMQNRKIVALQNEVDSIIQTASVAEGSAKLQNNTEATAGKTGLLKVN